ncbi:MAG TPA: hypothetical protein VFQ65_04930 [Kofleriaceae bacterium]|nr:hypothetical protein [Kofleriaceae bacterium]
MLIAVERLLLKLRQPRSRADELIELHGRLRAELRSHPDAEEPLLARAILEQKLRVSALVRDAVSCASCATGQPFPVGHHDGGACCAGVTADLFDDDELAALAHAGTRPGDLIAPREDHAGCAFRGSTGCTLDLGDRPARCVHYVCDTLRREVHARGDLDTLERELAELTHRVQRFRTVRSARVDRQVLAPLFEAIADARRKS